MIEFHVYPLVTLITFVLVSWAIIKCVKSGHNKLAIGIGIVFLIVASGVVRFNTVHKEKKEKVRQEQRHLYDNTQDLGEPELYKEKSYEESMDKEHAELREESDQLIDDILKENEQ